MPQSRHSAGMFPALLKYWRNKRGMSQLDLALQAEVSARHISFLETGRAAPSAEMVLRLAATLDVSLRQANAMLHAAGHPLAYPEPGPGHALPPEIAQALAMLKAHQEPHPLVVVDRCYNVLDVNQSAAALFGALLGEPPAALDGLNLARMTFAPRLRAALGNFEELGRALLWRMQRELLADPHDDALRALLDEITALAELPEDWRAIDLTVPAQPVLLIHLRINGRDLKFIAMLTVFQAPQAVLLDELRIETWLPCDPDTAAYMAAAHAARTAA